VTVEIIPVLIPALVMLIMMGGMFVLLSRMYKRIPANRALVRTGIGGMQVSHGTGAIVVPTMHTYGLVSLEPARLQIPGAIVEGNDADSEWQFTVAVGATREQIMAAATRLLDRETDEIAQLAREIITGELSRDAGSSESQSRHDMEERIRDALQALGLELISCGPVEIGDAPSDMSS
jgi:uncharacterized membrane protein YqiK